MKHLDDLFYWINEREAIRRRKENDQWDPPWTEDPIMANNRWCNVRREHDKVTRWIHNNFMPSGLGDDNLPIAMCIARMVNWPDTLQELGYPMQGWTPEYRQHFLETFAKRREKGLKSWTGAYMVTGGYSEGGETKEAIIARVLDGAAYTCRRFIGSRPSMLSFAAGTLTTPGMGSFLVAQVIADLKHTEHLAEASDWYSWCAPGPGSQMGLNFIHERPRVMTIPCPNFIAEVNVIRELILKKVGLQLCAQNTQNCLCELSKYIRAKYHDERLKNKYVA
jgi:5-hmdU DNA kinase-like protein